MIKDNRLSQRHRFPAIPCLIELDNRAEALSGEIIDASEYGAFLWLAELIEDVYWHTGMIRIEHLEVAFVVVRSGCGPVGAIAKRSWVALKFNIPSKPLLALLEDISIVKTPSRIIFEARINISELSLLESFFQLLYIYAVTDSASHILQILKRIHGVEVSRLLPPRLVSISGQSPLKGAIEAVKDIVSVIKTADDLLRHRREMTELKQHEVKQQKEYTEQQKYKTVRDSAESRIADVNAVVRENTGEIDILLARTEALRKSVELSRDEVTLFRERLSAMKEAWQFGKEVFGENSAELDILQKKLLPAMKYLLEDKAGLDLRFSEVSVESIDSDKKLD